MNDLRVELESRKAWAEDERWLLAKRVADSRCFQRSARLRDFLLFVVEQQLSGRGEEVTEQWIGVQVFGKQTSYSPAEDNLVRVSARSLRTKLKEYFDTEGLNESLLLEIPKGSYLAEFRPRVVVAERVERNVWKTWALVCAGLLVIAMVWIAQELWTRIPSSTTPIGETLEQDGQPLHIVLTDSAQVQLNSLLGRTVTLQEYLNREALLEEARQDATRRELRMIQSLADRQITSWADVRLLERLGAADPTLRSRWKIHHARHVQVRNFKSDHYLILSTWSSNPWAALFEESLEFKANLVANGNGGSRQAISNLKPQPGEEKQYVAVMGNDGSTVGPVRIAVLPNLSGSGKVILIAGLTMEGTEAGVEFMSDPKRIDAIRQRLGVRRLSEADRWELLLEATSLQGTAKNFRIVGHRLHR